MNEGGGERVEGRVRGMGGAAARSCLGLFFLREELFTRLEGAAGGGRCVCGEGGLSSDISFEPRDREEEEEVMLGESS